MKDEKRQIGRFVVERYQIVTTPYMVYRAYEPYGGHTSMKHFGTGAYGDVATRPLPAELEALPAMTDERVRAVTAWRESKYDEAYRIIIEAFPEAAGGKKGCGDITLLVPVCWHCGYPDDGDTGVCGCDRHADEHLVCVDCHIARLEREGAEVGEEDGRE